MKFRKITLGIGNLWNDTARFERDVLDCFEASKVHSDFLQSIVKLVTEQQALIEQQIAEIENLKTRMYKIESDINKPSDANAMKMTG